MLGNSVGFAAGSTYKIVSVDASGYSVYNTEISFCTPSIVTRYIEDAEDFQEKAAVSLNELFTCYSTTESGFCFVNMESGSTSGLYEPSGDFRAYIRAENLASGFNVGLIPTFGSGIQDSMSGIQDNTNMIDVRGIAIRMPTIFAGPGYTTEGFPTPSLYDDYLVTSGESYFENPTESGKIEWYKRNFARSFRERQDLWKAGPFDARWDDDKKMWVSAPELFQGYTMDDIPAASGRYAPTTFSSGRIELIVGNNHSSIVPKPTHQLYISNRSVTTDIASGTYVIAMRANNYEYIPIHIDCVPDRSGIYSRISDG